MAGGPRRRLALAAPGRRRLFAQRGPAAAAGRGAGGPARDLLLRVPEEVVHLAAALHRLAVLTQLGDLALKASDLLVEVGHLVVVATGHLLHLLPDEVLLVKELGLHLSDLLVLSDQLVVLLLYRLLKERNFLLEIETNQQWRYYFSFYLQINIYFIYSEINVISLK